MGFWKSRRTRHPFCTAIVAAAGHSSRMGEDKLLMDLAGKPVLLRTLRAIDSTSLVDEIMLRLRETDRDNAKLGLRAYVLPVEDAL